MKTVMRIYGTFCMLSLLFWAFTGMTLWAPTVGGARETVLTFVHVYGVFAFIIGWFLL